MKIKSTFVILFFGLYLGEHLNAQTVEQCEAEIGIDVPEFDCDDGTLVPTTIGGVIYDSYGSGLINDYGSLKCDRPNVLNSNCDPGSRFQVLKNTPDAYLVAHCRRKGSAEGVYGDIAMIQHNKTSGATCFYQSGTFSSRSGPKNNIVKAPKTGASVAPLASSGCMSCHDSGPLIRTPYLTQVTEGDDVIPGAGDNNFNKNQPYYIVGNERAKSYSVEVEGNNCTSCHSLSIWSSGSFFYRNTAGHLAKKATTEFQLSKLPTSSTAPMWMSLSGPNAVTFNPMAEISADEIVECANTAVSLNNLPNTPECTVKERVGRVRKALSLVSAAGQCIDIEARSFDKNLSEVPILSYECYAENINQKWTYTEDRSVMSEDGHCLNATGVTNGSPVTAVNCDGSISQRWAYNALTGTLENDVASGMCLDMHNTNTMEHEQKIQLWACNGSRVQRWAMADLKYQRLQNDSVTSEYIHIQNQNEGVSVIDSGAIQSIWSSAQWSVERVDDYYRIRNRWKKKEFLHIENDILESGEIEAYWSSPLWILHGQPARGPNVYTFQNRWKPWLYLSLDATGKVQIETKQQASGDSIYWNIKDVN